MQAQHTYQLRPGYGSKELLLEFTSSNDFKLVVKNILEVFDKLNLIQKNEELLLDDQLIHFIGQNGEVTLNIDNWENIFILCGKNQKDILLIDKALDNSSLFKKQQVNFENYTL